jgi:RNA polymerase sigma factor (sigma-70 family)
MRLCTTSSGGRDFQTLFGLGVSAAMSDQQLLEQFVARRGSESEDAFAALVDRHRTMVWRVCRRILVDPNDADDAFQVTFLVLARKARSISCRPLLANWLYGVAVRSSKEVRTRAARQRAMEAKYRSQLPRRSLEIAKVEPLLEVLDHEINRLPEVFRSAVVLCDVEGRSQQEAAQLLGIPIGTIASRLSRARERLRRQLERRGCSASPAVIAATLSHDFGMLSRASIFRSTHLAECLASGAVTAAEIPAPLFTLMYAVAGTMRFAPSVAKTSVVCLGLFLAACGAFISMTARGVNAPRSQRAASDEKAPEVSGITKTPAVQSAKELTAARLKRCLSSARTNFAALARATYDFDFRQEVAQLDNDGEPQKIYVRNYHGKVYWRNGSVRYDVNGPPLAPQLDTQGRPLETKPLSVIRTGELVATRDSHPRDEQGIHTEKPPETVGAWKDRHTYLLAQIDPWVFYAKSVRIDEPALQNGSEKPEVIRSEEDTDTIVIRLRRRGQVDARVEIVFDKRADCLPTHYRVGTTRDGRWIPWAETSCEWRKTGDVWFPAHQVEIGYVGKEHKPVKFFDLAVRNLRVNAEADVPDSVFDPKTLPVR